MRLRMAVFGVARTRFGSEWSAGDHPEITLELRVQAAAALAAVTVALSAWAQSAGADQLPTLVDRAFHALRRPPVGNDGA